MAKDLVRTRRYVKKFIMMKANIQAVSLKIQTLKSNQAMTDAMKGVTKAMQTMNRQVGVDRLPINKIFGAQFHGAVFHEMLICRLRLVHFRLFRELDTQNWKSLDTYNNNNNKDL